MTAPSTTRASAERVRHAVADGDGTLVVKMPMPKAFRRSDLVESNSEAGR
jgi:hypothetical protein